MKITALTLLIIIFGSSMKCQQSNKPDLLLQYKIRQPKVQTNKAPLLLLLHGYGSNESDLFSLADQLPDSFMIVSARAPYTLTLNSYAWFDITFAGGKPVNSNKEQAEKSRNTIIQFIDQLKQQYAFDTTQIYVSGFSQGGIMSYSVGLTRPDKIKGIAVMSGRLLNEVKPLIVQNDKLKQLNVFVSHGTNDNVIGIQYARESVAYLEQLGLKPVFKEYPAGHSITPEMLRDLNAWFKKVK